MRYRLTPMNVFAALCLGVLIVSLIEPDDKWGVLALPYLGMIIVLSLALDFFLQKMINRYGALCLIEVSLIGALILLNSKI
jgi:hypothetical protein